MGEQNRYLVIQEWMLHLGLKPSEVQAFALIFGFSQDGKSTFHGSSEYISYWLGLSQTATLAVLARLVSKGFLDKLERKVGSVKYVDYRVSLKFIRRSRNLRRTAQETCAASTQETYAATAQETCVHNNTDNNNKIIKSISDLRKQYES